MIETVLKFPYAAAVSALQLILGRPRLRLECGWSHEPNQNEIGNYLALWIKIINPTRDIVYFDRVQGKDLTGETFFPLVFGVQQGQAIPARNNVVAVIPCGHIVKTYPRELVIVDATETLYRIRGKKLSEAVVSLAAEFARLQALGLEVHPSRSESKQAISLTIK